MAEAVSNQAEIRQAFEQYDRQVILHNVKIGCWIGVTLMPLGVLLDYVVYRQEPEVLRLFLGLRLLCSLLIGVFWAIVVTPLGHKHPRKLGITLAMIPTFFMSWMIYAKDGPTSTYYAGLNLVLLVIGFVLYWTFTESLVAVSLVILMYLSACWLHEGAITFTPALLSNLYFLGLTGVIVMTGSYFHSQFRFREFALRFELDLNRRKLEETNQKLLELDQIKTRFFANISHELRTPLTLLIAPLEMLMQRFQVDAESRSLLATMHANGMRLLKLINDLLDLVRLESGRIEVKSDPLEVTEFTRGLASAARQMADDKRLRLETHVDPALGTVLADRDKLEKIVLNLVFNALKFTPSGGRVEVRAEKQGEEFVLLVADTGMGIAEKNLPYVFDRFWQADTSSKRKYQGVGIGLSLVKEFAEAMGGTATVQSQEGKGTTFTVRLPYRQAAPVEKTALAPAPEGAPALAPGTVTSEEWLTNLYRRAELFPALTPLQETVRQVETARNGGQPTILIADDEPDMLRFLKSQLSPLYHVIEAVDGQQAIDKARQFLPDIILLDMMMPEKDGLQACREIREQTSLQTTPIVLLTARADNETKMAALSAGASDFLGKPFSTAELHVRIKNLVESFHYQRQLAKQNTALESALEQLKETESQLVQSEKMRSLGVMSAGIMHEIKNPLNVIGSGLFTLGKQSRHLAPELRADYQQILDDVQRQLDRVTDILADLRTFSHPETEGREDVPIAEITAAALRLLSGEWREKVRIEQHLADHQTIAGNRNLLIHVVVNLLQNSLDALGEKRFAAGEEPTIWLEGRREPGRSILVVRDNGTGIKDEHRDKIFDPFFTTKDVGAGMGLGLSLCYRLVEKFDGRISLRTEPGRFCEFTLEFPAKG